MRVHVNKKNVLELYPHATCSRFPVVQPTIRPTRFIVKLAPGEPRFASGNTAAQAWRRAYEKILADTPAAVADEREGKK
jgi:hypothetical protein